MKRKLWLLAATMLLATSALASFAQAAGGPPDNQYEGRIEKDSATYFGFDLSKSGGKTRATKVKVGATYHCGSGEGGFLFGRGKGSLRVHSDDTFGGKLKARFGSSSRGGFSNATYAIHGRLAKHGKATGTIKGELDFVSMTPRGADQDHCYTGGLDWKAKRGADVTLSTDPIRGAIR